MNDSQIAEADMVSPQRRINAWDVAIATLTFVTLLAMALLAWQLAPLLLLILGGALVAIFFRALAGWTTQWTNLSYGWSLSIVIALLMAIVSAGLFLGGQMIADQMADLTEQVPKSLEKLREDAAEYSWGKRLIEAAPSSTEEIPMNQADAASYATTAVYSLAGVVAALLIVLFLGTYFAIDYDKYVGGAVRLAPLARRERLREVLGEVHQTLRWWLLGKIGSMFIVGVLTSVGLAALGVPLALALGVIAALLTFVPNFGPVISAVPAVLLGFVQSPTTAIYVVILYLAIQTVESYLITPLIQERTVSLPPGLTISAQIGMGILLGAGGIVLATPVAAASLVVIKRLYVEDALENAHFSHEGLES